MKCNNCKHANWKRNVRGSLHPDKTGVCTYEKRVQLPSSCSTWGISRFIENGALVIRGHHIERDTDLIAPCPVFERLK